MIDIVALWVGRVVLGLMAVTVATVIIGIFVIGFQVVGKAARDAWTAIRTARKGE